MTSHPLPQYLERCENMFYYKTQELLIKIERCEQRHRIGMFYNEKGQKRFIYKIADCEKPEDNYRKFVISENAFIDKCRSDYQSGKLK